MPTASTAPKRLIVTVPDGDFDAYAWFPAGSEPAPGLVLIHEIFGVGEYIADVAHRLAVIGYAVVAPDLFWRIQSNWRADHTEEGVRDSLEVSAEFDPVTGVNDVIATAEVFRQHPRSDGSMGVIGFCLGGSITHLTAAAANPEVMVSYYGSAVPDTTDKMADIRCPGLYVFGDNDPYIPRDQVDRVARAAEEYPALTVRRYPAGHAFDNHAAPMFYNAEAAEQSWPQTVDFLSDHLPVKD